MNDTGKSAVKWSDKVDVMFDAEHDGFKWNELYNGPVDRLDKHIFRTRRDITARYILERTANDALVLDLGCGAGALLEQVASQRRCIGLDYSSDLLEYARQRLTARGLQVPLHQGDCRSTEFADNSFELVSCLGVISYVEDYQPVLREIRRILKPGGTAIISTRSLLRPVLSDPYLLLKHTMKTVLRRRYVEDLSPGRFLNPDIVEQDIMAAGFEVLTFHGIGYGPFGLFQHRLFGEAGSIRLSRALEQSVLRARWRWVKRHMADVNLWVCE